MVQDGTGRGEGEERDEGGQVWVARGITAQGRIDPIVGIRLYILAYQRSGLEKGISGELVKVAKFIQSKPYILSILWVSLS